MRDLRVIDWVGVGSSVGSGHIFIEEERVRNSAIERERATIFWAGSGHDSVVEQEQATIYWAGAGHNLLSGIGSRFSDWGGARAVVGAGLDTHHALWAGQQTLATHSHTNTVHTAKCYWQEFNPFTPESDQRQNSPAASQEMWHHIEWRTWLFIAYSDETWLYNKFSLHHSYNHFLKGWENTLFELRSERVNCNTTLTQWCSLLYPVLGCVPAPESHTAGQCPPSRPWTPRACGGLSPGLALAHSRIVWLCSPSRQ